MKILSYATALALLSGLAAANTSGPGEENASAAEFPAWKTLFASEDVNIGWGGRLMNDWTWATGDMPYDVDDGVEFRRARFFAKGTLYDLIGFKTQYDFAGSDVDFKDVYFEVKDTPAGNVRVGHFKEPFSLEEQTSSRFITFAERTVMNAFSPARNTGLMFSDSADRNDLTWALGVFRDADDTGDDNTGDEPDMEQDGEYAVTGRVTGTVLHEDEGERVVHLGASYSLRGADDGMVRFRSRPEAHLANRVADTGTIMSDGVDLGGIEAAWVHGPFSLQGELVHASVDNIGGMDPDFGGYYVEGSYFLTGEHRAYKGGKFDRVKPRENVTRGNWNAGAWQVAARYSMLDLADTPAFTHELENMALGVKWILNPHTRILLNWVHSEFESGGPMSPDADYLILRFQIDW